MHRMNPNTGVLVFVFVKYEHAGTVAVFNSLNNCRSKRVLNAVDGDQGYVLVYLFENLSCKLLITL